MSGPHATLQSDGFQASKKPERNDAAAELIFLGTGTSSSLPHVACLTAGPGEKKCEVCLSTLHSSGKHNIRRNTSVVIRIPSPGRDGETITILIDCGKNYQAAALEWFPKYKLRRIDAVLITHAHADAFYGLDDLRAWTLDAVIQPYIDIYASEVTYRAVQQSFPYLVNRQFASGGGDVPAFKWHIIDEQTAFEIGDTGVKVIPIPVHHGRIFSVSPSGLLPTPNATVPSTPTTSIATFLPEKLEASETILPFICFGYKIQEQIVYLGDVSSVPENSWALLETNKEQQLPVLVLDCLRLKPHISHLGIEDSVAVARRVGAQRTYLTGFTHNLMHREWTTISEVLGGRKFDQLTDNENEGISLAGQGAPLWIRPGHDGLRVKVNMDDLAVTDESYD